MNINDIIKKKSEILNNIGVGDGKYFVILGANLPGKEC